MPEFPRTRSLCTLSKGLLRGISSLVVTPHTHGQTISKSMFFNGNRKESYTREGCDPQTNTSLAGRSGLILEMQNTFCSLQHQQPVEGNFFFFNSVILTSSPQVNKLSGAYQWHQVT